MDEFTDHLHALKAAGRECVICGDWNIVHKEIDIRNWKEVVWAIATRADPVRDTMLVENTPVDYLDFASPEAGLGGKISSKRISLVIARRAMTGDPYHFPAQCGHGR